MRVALMLAAAMAAASSCAGAAQPLTPPLAHFAMPQQAMPAFIRRYQLDYASLDRKYTVANGNARTAEMRDFYQQWRTALDAMPLHPSAWRTASTWS